MEALGGAASIIAVVDLSAKITSQCFQYLQEVHGAKEEITTLQEELGNLQDVLKKLKNFPSQPGGTKLSDSPGIKGALAAIRTQLQELDNKLDIKKSHNPLKRYGVQTLKWPFESKKVEKIITHLESQKSAITLALQVDQMYMAVFIHFLAHV